MNGMALHGGIIPYGGTFLVFTDYARPAIRLSALQNARVIYVMTHDSIGLGEDGPTHQPIEHCRACGRCRSWTSIARRTRSRPPMLGAGAGHRRALDPRAHPPNLRPVRTKPESENLCARGAYRLKTASAARKVDLSDRVRVEIALDVAERLEARYRHRRGVDPCTERFDAQPRIFARTSCPMSPTAKSCACRSRPGPPSGGNVCRASWPENRDRPLRRLGSGQGRLRILRPHARQDHRSRARPYETKRIA